jgi:hypothetical protein
MFSQHAEDEAAGQMKKNGIFLTYGTQHGFDGSPFLQKQGSGRAFPENSSEGIEYWRGLGVKTSCMISVTGFSYYFWESATNPYHPGVVIERQGFYFDALYARDLWSARRWNVSGIAGLNFRQGIEELFLYTFLWETNSEDHRMKDWGVNAGARCTYRLGRHWSANCSLLFTQYIWRYDKGGDNEGRNPHNFLPKRTSDKVLRGSVGVGFLF